MNPENLRKEKKFIIIEGPDSTDSFGSLAIRPYQASHLVNPSDGTLCLHTVKTKGVKRRTVPIHICVYVCVYTREN